MKRTVLDNYDNNIMRKSMEMSDNFNKLYT